MPASVMGQLVSRKVVPTIVTTTATVAIVTIIVTTATTVPSHTVTLLSHLPMLKDPPNQVSLGKALILPLQEVLHQ